MRFPANRVVTCLASCVAVPLVLLTVPACDRIESLFKGGKGGKGGEGGAAGKAAAEPPPIEVVAIPAEARDVAVKGEWVAIVDGSVNAEIRARVSGHLDAQRYAEGSLVRKGDLLFEIDPRPFEATLADRVARLAKAKADQSKTATDVSRLTPLAAKRAVSQQELDDAVSANEANLALIQAAEADVDQARLSLEFTKVHSPIDGIAGKATAQLGELVGPASGPLTVVSTVDPLRVYFHATEREYLAGREQLSKSELVPFEERPERMELLLADGTEFPHKGRFLYMDREVAAGTGSIRFAVQFPNPGNVLRPGQFARIRTVMLERKGATVIPQRAVRDVQGSSEVVVIADDDTAEIRQVKTGERIGSDWVIIEGLEPGELIVVEGVQKMRQGTRVKPVAPKAPVTTRSARTPTRDAKPQKQSQRGEAGSESR